MKNFNYWYEDDIDRKFRTSALDILNVNINPMTRTPLSLKEECIMAALDIHRQYPDIHIALSGGWESQICLRSFIEAGIKPSVYILKFQQGLNNFDSNVALDQCKKYNLIPRVISVNFEEVIRSHMILTASKYQTYSFIQMLHAYYIEQIKENILLVDKIDLRRDTNPTKEWSLVRNEDYNFWPERFNSLNDNKIINNFFTHSSELMYSFLKLPVITDLMNMTVSGKISLNSLKHTIYQQGGYLDLFENGVKKFVKTVSFEEIPGLHQKNSDIIEQHLKFRARQTYISYKDLIIALENKGIQCRYI